MTVVGLQNAAIFGLPIEVFEQIVLNLAEYPHCIATLARTCRYFRSIIYDPTDSHLWRNIFLAVYDDPRAANHLVKDPVTDFDWGSCFRERVRAFSYFKTRSPEENYPEGEVMYDPDPERNRKSLETILGLVASAVPYTSIERHATGPSSSQLSAQGLPEPLMKAHRRAPDFAPHPPEYENTSKNILAYRNALYRGVPAEVSRLLQLEDLHNGISASPDALAFYQFVAYSGYTEPVKEASTAQNLLDPEVCPQFISNKFWPAKVASSQHAQKTVYNMAYPQARRMYGPFTKLGQRSTDASGYGADWAQLAAIRQVAETALYREFQDVDIPITKCTALRAGRWSPTISHVPLSGSSAERDWAGVTGLWRRLVTWYGYDTLLELNASSFSSEVWDPEFEITIVAPSRLRIISYTHNDGAPAAFPTLNIEGEMGGQGWEVAGDIHEARQRHLSGKITMLGDGSVRWKMYSYDGPIKESSVPLYHSEGVQLGGIGSAAGVIGTWTCATHDEDDPIGSFWQWRVE